MKPVKSQTQLNFGSNKDGAELKDPIQTFGGQSITLPNFEWQRPEALERLKRHQQMDPVLLLTGLKGVGKEALVRLFIQANCHKAKYIYIDQLFGLKPIIERQLINVATDKATERAGHKTQAILDLLEEVSNFDVVVWHNSENISDLDRRVLLTQLQRQSPGTFHILISDEIYLEQLPFRLAKIHLEPYTEEQCLSYFNWLNVDGQVDFDLTDIMDRTKGFPPLIQIYYQSQGRGELNMDVWFEQLKGDEQELMGYCCMAGRPCSWEELQSAFIGTVRLTKKLEGLWLLGQNQQGHWIVPSFIKALFMTGLSSKERVTFERKFLSNHDNWLNFSDMTIVWHAFLAEDLNRITYYLEKIFLDDLESISANELRKMAGKIDELLLKWSRPEATVFTDNLRLMRFYLRLHFLLGSRSIGIEKVGSKVEGLLKNKIANEEAYWLILEFVEGLNLLQRCQEAAAICKQILSKVCPNLKPMFLIQYACAVSGEDEASAIRSLNRAILESQSCLEELRKVQSFNPQKQHSQFKTLALANFELARIEERQLNYPRAIELYEAAIIYFGDNNQSYHMLVAHLNLAWIFLKQYSWRALSGKINLVHGQAEDLGARYILAGNHLIQSIVSRLFLRYSESFKHLKLAKHWLPEEAPIEAQFDLGAEEFNTLMVVGQFYQAEECLTGLDARTSNLANVAFTKRRKGMRQRYAWATSEVDGGNLYSKEEGSLAEQNLRRNELQVAGMEPIVFLTQNISDTNRESIEKQFLNFPLGNILILERKITASLGHDIAQDQVYHLLTQMELMLTKAQDVLPQTIALSLVRYHLGGNSELCYLNRAKEDLKKWESHFGPEWGLRTWMIAIDNKGNPEDSQYWKELSCCQRLRWQAWFRPFFKLELAPYDYLSEKGSLKERTRSDLIEPFMVVDNTSAEVFLSSDSGARIGDRITPLIKSHRIRKILVTLLESFPSPVNKEYLSQSIWGEEYSPLIHDNRIYISIQRLRKYLALEDSVLCSDEGYQWNPKQAFLLIRSGQRLKPHAHQIISALTNQFDQGHIWLSRGQLLKSLAMSESTLKRELTRLLGLNRIMRRGGGRGTVYSLKFS